MFLLQQDQINTLFAFPVNKTVKKFTVQTLYEKMYLYLVSMTFKNISNIIHMVIYWPDGLYIDVLHGYFTPLMSLLPKWQEQSFSFTYFWPSVLSLMAVPSTVILHFWIRVHTWDQGNFVQALPQCKSVSQWKCAAESWKMASGEFVTEGEVLSMFTKYYFSAWKSYNPSCQDIEYIIIILCRWNMDGKCGCHI